MKKLTLIPIAILIFACNSYSQSRISFIVRKARVEWAQGKDVNMNATGALKLGFDGNTFGVIGNLIDIQGIDTTGWQVGSTVFLIFKTGTQITVKQGVATGLSLPIYLNPAEDWIVQAGANIELQLTSTGWIQKFRNY